MASSQGSQKPPGSPRKRSPRKVVPKPVKRRFSQATVPHSQKNPAAPKTLHHFFAKQTAKAEATKVLQKIGDSCVDAVVIDSDEDVNEDAEKRGRVLARELFSPSPTKSQVSESSESLSQRTVSLIVEDDENGPGLQPESEEQPEPGGSEQSTQECVGSAETSQSEIVSVRSGPITQDDGSDTDDFMANLPEPEESPSKQSSTNYEAKTFAAVWAKASEKKLLSQDDTDRLEKFFRLGENAQELWLRLYQRKHQWISRSRISYKIDYIDSSLRVLVEAGCLFDKNDLTDLRTLLNLLSQKDVLVLGRKFCDPKKCATKGAAIDELMVHSTRKDVLFGAQRIRDSIVKSGQQMVEQCYLIEGSLAGAVTRALTIVSLGSHFDTFTSAGDKNDHGICNLFTISQFMRNKFEFPEYVVVDVFPALFAGPEDFRLYCDARRHGFKLSKLIETHNWDGALAKFEEAFAWFMETFSREKFLRDAALPWFLHRFTYSYCFLRCLAAGAEICERHKCHQDAVDLYCTILSQTAFQQNRRGLYWIRLLLDVDVHLKLSRNSVCLASLALEDGLAPQHVHDIFIRAKRLSQRFDVRLPALTEFSPPTEAPVETIDGQLVKRDIIGRRNVFASVDEAGERIVGPEAVAIDHYLLHGYTNGVHGETRTVHMLFAVLCWDVLFGAPSESVPGAPKPRGVALSQAAELEAIKRYFRVAEVVSLVSDSEDDQVDEVKPNEGERQDTLKGTASPASKRRRKASTKGGKKSGKSKQKPKTTEVAPIPHGKYFLPDLFPDVRVERDADLQKAVYISEYQSGPLDLGYPEFYLNRRTLIEDHLAALASMSTDEIVALGRANYEAHSGRVNPLFSWEVLTVEELTGLLACIPVEVLVAICRQLLVDFRFYRSGFPDIIMWNTEARRWKVVEVKGPGDILSTKQRYWMHLLLSLGVDCATCRVTSVHSRKIRAEPNNRT